MTERNLLDMALRLEREILDAGPDRRLAMQPEFSRVLDRLRMERVEIPRRLLQLEAELADEAIEARFDNLPL